MKKALAILALILNAKTQINIKPINVNVFVHGTVGSRMFALYPGREYPKKLKIKHELYRQEEFPRKNQILPNLGMHQIFFKNDFNQNTASEQIIKVFDKANKQQIKNYRNKINLYYAFGWSGSLDKNQRLMDSNLLLHEIITLDYQVKKKYPGHKINISLIGISHGVNVIMAAIEIAQKQNVAFPNIKNIISIAGPIVEESLKNASNPYTKNFVHLYSKGDYIQNFDNKSTDLSSSKRSLKKHLQPHNTNIYQAKISIGEGENTYLPTHTDMVSIPNIRIDDFISSKEKAALTFFYKTMYYISKNKFIKFFTRKYSPTKKKTIQEYLSEITFKILSGLNSKKIIEKKKLNFINPIPLVCLSRIIADNLKKNTDSNTKSQIILNQSSEKNLMMKIKTKSKTLKNNLISEFDPMKNEMSSWLQKNNKIFYKNKLNIKKRSLKTIDIITSHIELFWDEVGSILKNISQEMNYYTKKLDS